MAGQIRKPVFIIGCGRSGTTILFDLLKEHPGLAPTTGHPDGEDHVGWVTHGGAIIAGLGGHAYGDGGGSVVGHSCCLHMTDADVTPQIRAAMHDYYRETVLRQRAGLRVLNKCPHLSNKIGFVKAIFPDARFVHIVREPVAMVASWAKIMTTVPNLAIYWPEANYPCLWVFDRKRGLVQEAVLQRDARFYPGGGLLRFADYWSATNGGIPEQAQTSAAELLTLKYEELVSDPEIVLRRITDFCELDPIANRSVSVEQKLNERYRHLLKESDVSEIRRITSRAAGRFGYG